MEAKDLIGRRVMVNLGGHTSLGEPAIVLGHYIGNSRHYKNYIAIEFETEGKGVHTCENDNFDLIRYAKNGQGFFIDKKFVRLITEKPHIGKRHNTKIG